MLWFSSFEGLRRACREGASLGGRLSPETPGLDLASEAAMPRRHDVDPVVDDDHHSDGKIEGTNRCIKLVT